MLATITIIRSLNTVKGCDFHAKNEARLYNNSNYRLLQME